MIKLFIKRSDSAYLSCSSSKAIDLRTGFTLIETAVAVSIVLVLAALSLAGLSSFRDSSLLSKTADEAASALKTARSRTLASENALSYGVYFGTSTVILFPGTTYSVNNSANEITDISPRVEISSNTLTASSTAFRRLTGEATISGSVTFRLKSNPSKTKTITIYGSGLFSIQ